MIVPARERSQESTPAHVYQLNTYEVLLTQTSLWGWEKQQPLLAPIPPIRKTKESSSQPENQSFFEILIILTRASFDQKVRQAADIECSTMRQSSPRPDKRRRLRESRDPRSNDDAKSGQQERDRDHLEQDDKHAYVHSWIQTLPSQPSFDDGPIEADQDIEDVERWKPHNLPLSKYRSGYGNKLDQNRSSWVLRDHPLQSPPRPNENDNGSSGSSSASVPSGIGTDHQNSESLKQDVYRKRPRARTRPERYDSNKRASHTAQNKHRPSRKRKSGTKRRKPPEEKSPKMRSSGSQALRSRKDIMNRFTSSAIPSTTTRVTLKPNFTAGLFMNGRGPLSGHNTEPADLDPPIDKSSAPMIHSDNLETTVPENGHGEEILKHSQLRTRNRRREYFDEAEDFFAHGHLDHERRVNANDAMAAQTKDANPTCAASKNQNMQESSSKGDPEGQALDGKACLQPDPEMSDCLESNTGPGPAAPVVSRAETLVNSPESDGSSIPTPILRRLFQTGVFSYQGSFVKDQREPRAPERVEIIPGSYLDGLGNNRALETNQFPACNTQPSTEELKHSMEPEYSVPGLHEKLRQIKHHPPRNSHCLVILGYPDIPGAQKDSMAVNVLIFPLPNGSVSLQLRLCLYQSQWRIPPFNPSSDPPC
ncbi:unnamed protein product [Clonostachys solani]|uniref:Uncharacterized protein n=1 Tax=Clonostachys solani TaxID=160281 RepID=A0A9P0EI97_9HYPO|nr:unnamed protein product [Clonostachys solani]